MPLPAVVAVTRRDQPAALSRRCPGGCARRRRRSRRSCAGPQRRGGPDEDPAARCRPRPEGRVEILGTGAEAAPAVVDVLERIGVLVVAMILVFVEQDGGRPDRSSLEALTFARRARRSARRAARAVLFGPGAATAAAALGAYGVSQVHVVADERIDDYAPGGLGPGARRAGRATLAPSIVLAAGTDRGQEVLAYAAAMQPARRWPPTASTFGPGDPFEVDPPALGRQPPRGGAARRPGSLPDRRRARDASPRRSPSRAGRLGRGRSRPTLSDADLRVRVVARVAPGGRQGLAGRRAGRRRRRPRASAARRRSAELEELAGLLARRGRRLAGRDQRRLAAAQPAGRPDRDPDRARHLHRLRDQRRDPAHRRLQGRQVDPGDQHRPRGADHVAAPPTR